MIRSWKRSLTDIIHYDSMSELTERLLNKKLAVIGWYGVMHGASEASPMIASMPVREWLWLAALRFVSPQDQLDYVYRRNGFYDADDLPETADLTVMMSSPVYDRLYADGKIPYENALRFSEVTTVPLIRSGTFSKVLASLVYHYANADAQDDCDKAVMRAFLSPMSGGAYSLTPSVLDTIHLSGGVIDAVQHPLWRMIAKLTGEACPQRYEELFKQFVSAWRFPCHGECLTAEARKQITDVVRNVVHNKSPFQNSCVDLLIRLAYELRDRGRVKIEPRLDSLFHARDWERSPSRSFEELKDEENCQILGTISALFDLFMRYWFSVYYKEIGGEYDFRLDDYFETRSSLKK